ncbi:MAG: YggT family protein [Selenomonadales bacterium]|jgi:uncharacterized protein YggT (Ycf19 family)|nr:YggT family protein [Selenomonadales bacterium]
MQQVFSIAYEVFYWLMLFRLVASFMPIDGSRPPLSYVHALTEPLLAPIRRAFGLVRLGNIYIDVSPIVVLLLASILRQLLGYL